MVASIWKRNQNKENVTNVLFHGYFYIHVMNGNVSSVIAKCMVAG